jgi:hypothetical protein
MRYEADAEIWVFHTGNWHFVTLPAEFSEGIKTLRGPKTPGWGSVRVTARLGSSEWRTSIFPDSKSGAFLLPIKAEVRKRERVTAGDTVSLSVEIEI